MPAVITPERPDTPDATALIYEGQYVSYREFNRRANQLANYLKARGVTLETRVAICMERSVEMMISLFGVLKAGGAYVPIDPAYPRERIDYMLGNASAEVILTQRHLAERLSDTAVEDIFWNNAIGLFVSGEGR